MRRPLILLLALLELSILEVSVASSQTVDTSGEPVCATNAFAEAYECGGSGVGSTTTPPTGTAAGTWPPEGWVPYELLQFGADSEPCTVTNYRPPGSIAPEQVNSYDGGTFDSATYPACPAEPSATPDPAVLAARYWEQIPLPRPNPHIAPGWAITGKPAYLETNGILFRTYSNATPIGPLQIVATGRYFVGWGDGDRTGPYAMEGSAWPHGEITHEYITVGYYDVAVTLQWSGVWTLAGRSGTLRNLDVVSTIDDFPVRQIQAVIR